MRPTQLGGSRMEHKSIWKKFLILSFTSLIVFHANMAMASGPQYDDGSVDEGCVLEED